MQSKESTFSVWKTIISDHINFREQTLKMARNDLARNYRASALGWAWAFIKPVIQIFVYWFAMSIGFRRGKDFGDYNYFLWLATGLVTWFYISDMLNRGTDCMRKYKYLITKMHYPVSTIPTFVSLSNFYINLILFAVILLLHLIMGYYPTIYFIQLPFFLFLSFCMCTAWSLFAGPISAISQDFSNLVHSTVFGLLWLSGIFYDANDIGNEYIRILLKLNPITYIVNGVRSSFMGTEWFWESPVAFAVFMAELLIMAWLGCWSYKRLRKEMPDVL